MKINRIYIKIFLSFILLLLVADMLIFGLFRYLANFPHERYGEVFEAVASVSRRYASEQLTGKGRPDFLSYLNDLSVSTGVKIWLEDNKTVTFKTWEGEKPHIADPFLPIKKPSYTFLRKKHRPVFQVEIPLAGASRESLYLFYDGTHFKRHDYRFLSGLILITLILGLLLFPFSRYISRPLRKMRDSARRISRGHLDERVKVSGGDEIGQLGVAFNDMATSLEKMVLETREMTAHISHELRSPLARLRVAGELLEEKIKGGEGKAAERLFRTVNSEIEEMDYLIGQILLLSKIELRDASIEKKPNDFREPVNDIMERYSNLFKKRNLSLQMSITPEPVPVEMVKEDILMALSAVMDNAARYGEEHTSIEVSIVKEEEEVIFTVKNRGAACTEEEMKEIFAPFRRSGNSAGAGLGLSLVKKVIENHGGEVEAFCRDDVFELKARLYLSSQTL